MTDLTPAEKAAIEIAGWMSAFADFSKEESPAVMEKLKPDLMAIIQDAIDESLPKWEGIESCPKDGTTFLINSGPVPGNACFSNVEESGCEIEWYYNTLKTQGWTNNLAGLATHWMPIPKGPEQCLERQKGEG